MRISVVCPFRVWGPAERTESVTRKQPVSHAPVYPYFCVAGRNGAVDESLSCVETMDLKGSSRGGAATDVGLVGLDMEETVVKMSESRGGARWRAVLPLPAGHDEGNLETLKVRAEIVG